MRIIYKYELDSCVCKVELPVGYVLLQVAMQGARIVIWAMIDNRVEEKIITTFRTYGTGHQISEDIKMRYLNTVQDRGLVWHIFQDVKEVKKK